MEDPDTALELLDRLCKLGVRLSIDDFGTGYSSLQRLKRLPVHKLKIDQSFVHNLPDDRDDIAIAKAVTALGHSLGLQVLAEGIEHQRQADFLRGLGCDHGQGYLFSRPNRPCSWRKPGSSPLPAPPARSRSACSDPFPTGPARPAPGRQAAGRAVSLAPAPCEQMVI